MYVGLDVEIIFYRYWCKFKKRESLYRRFSLHKNNYTFEQLRCYKKTPSTLLLAFDFQSLISRQHWPEREPTILLLRSSNCNGKASPVNTKKLAF
jgi:hypothetical protein